MAIPADDNSRSRERAVAVLGEIGFWLERAGAENHRVRAYRRAAEVIAALDAQEFADYAAGSAWQGLPGVGPKIAAALQESSRGEMPGTLARLRRAGAEPLDPAGAELRRAVRGDLHVHTDWSDGGSSLEEMVATAERLGHEYLAITDHSPRLRVANGLDEQRLAAQGRRIEALQAEALGGPVILRGAEVDILADGGLDHSEQALATLEVVVASVHSGLRDDRETMTGRMVAAVAHPRTSVLGHCTGRLVAGGRGTRPESRFDAEVVFEACRRFGVAVEINSRPERLDPPVALLRVAEQLGCVFSIDSDAHAPGQLDFLDHGCALAQQAGIPADRVINTWPLDRLRRFLAKEAAAGVPGEDGLSA